MKSLRASATVADESEAAADGLPADGPAAAAAAEPAMGLVTGQQLGELLQVSADTVRRLSREGRLPVIVVAGRRRYSVPACLAALTAATDAKPATASPAVATATTEAPSGPQDASDSEPAEVSADEPDAVAVGA